MGAAIVTALAMAAGFAGGWAAADRSVEWRSMRRIARTLTDRLAKEPDVLVVYRGQGMDG